MNLLYPLFVEIVSNLSPAREVSAENILNLENGSILS